MLELSQPLLEVAHAQAQLHAQHFAAEAAAAAKEEAKLEEGAAKLKDSYYALAAQKGHMEQLLVRNREEAGGS